MLSERFEVARNFVNKLWNAARFSLMHLEGYAWAPSPAAERLLEDRWILSRLSSVTRRATEELEAFHFSEAARVLYEFAWDEFCSFYLEILEAQTRGSRDAPRRAANARRDARSLALLAASDRPLRERGDLDALERPALHGARLEQPRNASGMLIAAAWPTARSRPIDRRRSRPSSPTSSASWPRCGTCGRGKTSPRGRRCGLPSAAIPRPPSTSRPLAPYFHRMAHAELGALGPQVEPPRVHAAAPLGSLELFADLDGLIDVAAETARLGRDRDQLAQLIRAKQARLAQPQFVERAPPAVVQKEREALAQLSEQLALVERSLGDLNRSGG